MNKIILPRRGGKTTKLIDISENTGTYILVADRNRQREVAGMARERNKNIPFPVTLEDFLRTRFRGSFINHILIDDAEDVLAHLFGHVQIDALTITAQEQEKGCEYCETPGKTIGTIESDNRIFVGLSGAHIQIYDEDYPGFVENIPVRFCPMCGRKLTKEPV